MWRYTIIRSLMIIPTLIIISVVAFILSVSTPDDHIEILLQLQGVAQEDDRISTDIYNKAYKDLAISHGKNLPLFYFNIQPHYYPSREQWNTISTQDRIEIKSLLDQHILIADAQQYLKAIQDLKIKYYTYRDSISDKILKKDLKQALQLLQNPDQLIDIRKRIIRLANTHQDSGWINDISNLLVQIPADGNKVKWHLPTIEWNGTINQYHRWAIAFVKGDFGQSILDAQPVQNKLWNAIRWTSLLIALNFILSILISIPLAVLSAYRANTWIDNMISWLSLGIYSTPIFWLATIMIIFFTTDIYSSSLNIFPSPASFYGESGTSTIALLIKYLGRLALPVLCITLKDVAYLTRILRAELINESTKDYATTLRAKGIDLWHIMWKHMLPNSMISMTTLIINAIPSALAGTLIIEVIFNIPGMGRLLYSSITYSDWNVVFAILMLVSLVTIIFYLLGDLIYSWLNPRINFNKKDD